MAKIIHARLNGESERIFNLLHRQTGWYGSEIIRNGLKALMKIILDTPSKRIIGLAKFRSGRADLGSNKAHLRGFGRS